MAKVAEFSVEEKLVSVIRLQKIDSSLDQIHILKGELPIEVKDLEDEIEGLHARKTRIEEDINGMNQFIESKKQGIKEAEANITKYEKQSENVKNSREFETISRVIEMQHLEHKLHEKHIKDTTEEIAKKAQLLQEAISAIENKESHLTGKKDELQKIIGETEKEETALSAEAEDAKKLVDSRLLTSYERIRSNYRNGLAVVPVERDSCGGCFHAIPPQKQSEIKLRKKIMVCENCGRILSDADLFDSVEAK